MKYRSITINEELPARLVKFLTGAFASKEVKFGDVKPLIIEAESLKNELAAFEKSGLIKQILFERPFQWVLDVPDEPKLYDFYKFVLLIDNALVRLFRAYHMQQIDESEMKKLRLKIISLVDQSKAELR